MNDEKFMRVALKLAQKGEGAVSPNPLVGAVVVKDGIIVGQGYHQKYGGPHAESTALEEAGKDTQGATLYVTLEPCCHHGQTSPCTQQIIAAEIRRVVVACRDPNPLVNGKGIAGLRKAGIEVTEGVLEEDARCVNEIFLKFIATGLPFVHLKLATSLDGKIATRTGDSRWITGEASRTEAHRLRRQYSTVLVGVGTVIADDPQLTVRNVSGRNPIRLVLDAEGAIPLKATLLHDGAPATVVTAVMPEEKEVALRSLSTEVWRFPGEEGRIDLAALLKHLGEKQLDSVLIEGGSETAASFLEARLVDKVSLFVAPILLGGRDAVSSIGGNGAESISSATPLRNVRVERIGEDIHIYGYPEWKTAR